MWRKIIKTWYEGKMEPCIAYGMLALCILTLLPVMYLGRYNHPTGDDFYYGAETHLVWEETGSLVDTLVEAVKGVALQYQCWQGTYSAMFLMYLPPNVFSMGAYKWVTFVILACLFGGIFYLLKAAVCDLLRGSRFLYLGAASVLTMLCVQTVPSQGESFFWYNGSMYYTGFFALTLFYLGTALRYLKRGGIWRAVIMTLLSVFLAGGNYVSLLPALLLMACLAACLFRKHEWKNGCVIGLNALLLLIFLGVSGMAPGNSVRQSMLDKSSPVIAIALSLRQGLRYARAWTGIWWLLGALALLPLFWKSYGIVKSRFRYPLAAAVYVYGIFCSMSCPTFYTMRSTGPARAVAIVYYGFILSTFVCLYYVLGSLYRYLEFKGISVDFGEGGINGRRACGAGITAGIVLLAGIQLVGGAFSRCTSAKALALLCSGTAAAYEREFQERLKVLENETVKIVEFDPFENQPDMLYVGDISDDPEEPTNRKVADFFRKDAVRVRWYD